MAAYKSLLLVIALCAATVYSLRCYTCELQSSNSKCLTETNCTSNATSCLTSVASGSVGGVSATNITKQCAVSCNPSTNTTTGGTTTVTCCSTDLCNYSTSINSTSTNSTSPSPNTSTKSSTSTSTKSSNSTSTKSSYAAIILALGSILTILKSSVL
ncbi:ly6/PLAUR domain-containing protein 2-like [Bufo bufo]|uniref:ly6/PLAUR domain-containing protein 2-like n=1 Tax=Bufo bufo TaxID=8384 RepID=UPI001ABEAA1B|nr:ly6/PLAUR domain-containing protein 2-like [Bufo bufo]